MLGLLLKAAYRLDSRPTSKPSLLYLRCWINRENVICCRRMNCGTVWMLGLEAGPIAAVSGQPLKHIGFTEMLWIEPTAGSTAVLIRQVSRSVDPSNEEHCGPLLSTSPSTVHDETQKVIRSRKAHFCCSSSRKSRMPLAPSLRKYLPQ